MAYDTKKEISPPRDRRKYTYAELEEFDRSIGKYKQEVTFLDGTKAIVPDWRLIYFKAGVRNEKDEVLVYERPNGDCYTPQVEFERKIEQWDYWKFGNNKKLVQLETSALQEANDLFKNW